jgi:nitroreductase
MSEQDRRRFLKTGAVLGTGMTFSGIHGIDNGNDESEITIFDVFKKRRSVRSYKAMQVPEEHIIRIIDAARMAPTAGNQQPWKFLVVRNRGKLDELENACITHSVESYKERGRPSEEEIKNHEERLRSYYQKVFSAPVFIVVLVDTQSKWPSYNKHDGPLAAGYLMLAARALGYGTVFFTDSITGEVTRNVLGIPERYERICITPIGIPEEWPETPSKKDLDELIVDESF